MAHLAKQINENVSANKFDYTISNKFDATDCGPKLVISEKGLVVKYSGPNYG
jgi:hypothetical protein